MLCNNAGGASKLTVLQQTGAQLVQAANSTAVANCASVTIRTADDAEAVRKACPVIHGNLTIESSKQSATFLNLTGIEVVEGTFQTGCEKMPGPTMPDIGMGDFGMCSNMFNSSERVQTTIEALTLREIKGRFMLSWEMSLKNFTAPNLVSVGEYMFITGMSLEYLDLTSLEEVGHMSITNSGLKEVRHRQLKRILGSKTGRRTEISLYGLPNLKSVDSWVSGPVSVQLIQIDQTSADMTELTIGALKVDDVIITGKGNLGLTFGTDETKEMNLGKVQIRGLSGFKKNEKAENVKVGTFEVQHNEFTRLDIPFDDLGMLYMMYEKKLETLTLPEKAKYYTNLTVAIWDCERLDLKSEFVKGKDGEQVRGWYWPEKDMGRIAIYNTSVDETLL
jgi:hypothetical protein